MLTINRIQRGIPPAFPRATTTTQPPHRELHRRRPTQQGHPSPVVLAATSKKEYEPTSSTFEPPSVQVGTLCFARSSKCYFDKSDKKPVMYRITCCPCAPTFACAHRAARHGGDDPCVDGPCPNRRGSLGWPALGNEPGVPPTAIREPGEPSVAHPGVGAPRDCRRAPATAYVRPYSGCGGGG